MKGGMAFQRHEHVQNPCSFQSNKATAGPNASFAVGGAIFNIGSEVDVVGNQAKGEPIGPLPPLDDYTPIQFIDNKAHAGGAIASLTGCGADGGTRVEAAQFTGNRGSSKAPDDVFTAGDAVPTFLK